MGPFVAVLLAACGAAEAPPAPASPPSSTAAPAPAAPDPEVVERSRARTALERFVSAIEAGRWPEALALLSARWRGRYTPDLLARDFAASGPVGRQAAARARALLGAGEGVRVEGGTATLAVGQGKAAVLVAEDGSWRVDALE